MVWTQVKTQIQIVPMKKVLKKYLELPNVIKIALQSLNTSNTSHQVSSFIQGEYWQRIKSQCSDLLIPLSFSFDDLELYNPLGSHKKKTGAIYYTITSLPAYLSAKLDNWFLAQFHDESDYKRLGNKRTLGIFKEQLVDLQENGIEIEVDGVKHQVYFRIGRIIGDNLGLNQILGFVTGFTVTHYCRVCVIDAKQARISLEKDINLLRNRANYDKDVENSIVLNDHSRGVRERSIFEPLVHVTDLISVDVLHDWLEGIDRVEIPRILNNFMFEDENINLDIDDLNRNIKLLNIDSCNGINIPSTITMKRIINDNLKLTASEMFFIIA